METIKVEFKNKTVSLAYNQHSTIKQVIANAGAALSKDPHSIRLTYKAKEGEKPVSLSKESLTLQDYSIPSGATLVVKDLGKQIGYRTVFVLEYLGPLAIWWYVRIFTNFVHSYYNPGYLGYEWSSTQNLATILWTFHYGKRLFETFFVHKFSHATMPLFNLFKNCIYYWTFAFLIAYIILHNDYMAPPYYVQVAGVIIFITCELMNFMFVFLYLYFYLYYYLFVCLYIFI